MHQVLVIRRGMKKIQSIYKRYRFSRTQFIFSAILFTACGICTWIIYAVLHTQSADDWYESKVENGSLVTLPKDDAPHKAAMEWWYYNGHLISESGKQYSFHYTVFFVSNVADHIVSHASINEHQTGKHYTAQRRTAGNPSTIKENSFEFIQGDWLMMGSDGRDKLKIMTNDFSFDLDLTSTKLPVFHGGNGIIPLKDAGHSYYYSRTRMAVSGVVKINNTTEKVTGISWFDHQWGDFAVGRLSWEWFSLQLNDGIDLMIYQLHDRKTNEPILFIGSIDQNGNTENLVEKDFNIAPRRKWTSNKSKISYPTEWAIDIPSKNINLVVKSINESNEFDAMLTTYNIYWEGAIQVQGSHTGSGFMELYYMDKKH